jgi:lipoprotein-anchoring transpeptidase ErfK/SrfK
MTNKQLDHKAKKALIIINAPRNLWRCVFSLSVLVLILVSCAPAAPPASTSTPTASPLPSLTATATILPTLTSTITPTPEPAWYKPVNPSLGQLKFQYAEVANKRARVYPTFQDAVAKNYNFGQLPQSPAYVAYSASRSGDDGRTFFLTQNGWMDGADLQMLTPSTFAGFELTRAVNFRFGWVLADTQSVNSAGTPISAYSRYEVVHEVPAVTQNRGHIAVGADEWLPADKVALINPQVPAEAEAGVCRFIYVNIATQTLGVYEGCKLIFATLVSTGANDWTFEGDYNILYKVEYNSILPPETSTSKYYIEQVPYFMTYAQNFGFHGAYWHDNFGAAASHGCINLSPADAKWLYDWAVIGTRVIISPGK